MGLCASSSNGALIQSKQKDPLEKQIQAQENTANKDISGWMATAEKKSGRIKKLLLLGSGSSGKSTLFKQLKCIHNVHGNNGFLDEDYAESLLVIRRNCISGIVVLLQKAQEFYLSDPDLNEDCYICIDESTADPFTLQTIQDIKLVLLYSKEQFVCIENDLENRDSDDTTDMMEDPKMIEDEVQEDKNFTLHVLQQGYSELERNGNNLETAAPKLTWKVMCSLYHALARLWDLNPIKSTFDRRGVYQFSFPDNMDFFLDKVTDIFKRSYCPDNEDVLKCRIRTTGMVEQNFPVEGKRDMFINIYDVGGQRSERKKWIHYFEDVAALVFVAALNHYASVLFEDEKVNAMIESIQLFDEIVNSKWFAKTEIILFLNKDDLFRERLLQGIPLAVCFNDDDEDLPPTHIWQGEIWEGYNYGDDIPDHLVSEETMQPLTNEEWFIVCYKSALEFIQRQYTSCCKGSMGERIFTHVTTATNRDNVKKVYWDVQNIVVSSNLKLGGLV